MLEEMHDPILSQPIFVKAMSSQVRALKNICVCFGQKQPIIRGGKPI